MLLSKLPTAEVARRPTSLSTRSRSKLTDCSRTTTAIAAKTTDEIPTEARRPRHQVRCDGSSSRASGANKMTPVVSPAHHVTQAATTCPPPERPVMNWASAPAVAPMAQAMGPASKRVPRIALGVSKRSSEPTNRRTNSTATQACATEPMPTSATLARAPSSVASRATNQVRLAALAPMATPTRARQPKTAAAAKATPAAGHIAVPSPGR